MIIRYALMALLFVTGLVTAAEAPYRLSSGDVLKVSVFGEPDLSFDEIRLNDSGTFSYPFIGTVDARAKTPSEVEQAISNKLRDGYLVSPRVSVSVVTYRDFFISGEVKNPGGYPYEPGLTLDRAIARAGGLTERGSDKRVSIIRGNDARRGVEKAKLGTDIHPGDAITVDQGFF